MNEYNNKLEVIKNRCRTSAKVTGILRIFGIIGMIGSLVGVVIGFVQREAINTKLAEQVASGKITVESLKIDSPGLNLAVDYSKAFAEGDYANPIIISCIIAVIICAAVTVVLTLLKKVFADLSVEDTPFSESVIGRLKTSFIIITVVVTIFVGIGAGVLAGLFFWCVYSILDYGKVLQTEVDETL